MWRCQFSLLVCPSSYYFIYVFFLISSIVLFNMCRRSASVASSYLLTYSLHVELILLGYDGEDMIVLGTSGGGDDLVCNVVIFLGRPCLPWLRCPICGDLSTALDLCLHFCCFDVHSVALSCSFWTSDVSLATSKSNLSWFLAPFGLLTCPSPPRSPTPTILLYLDALTSPIRKRIRAMPVLLCYQHCSVRYIFNFALISSIS